MLKCTRLEQVKRAEWWCEELLGFRDNAEDVDGLVDRGEALVAHEKWEEAVRTLEKEFEASRDVSRNSCLSVLQNMVDTSLLIGNETVTKGSAPLETISFKRLQQSLGCTTHRQRTYDQESLGSPFLLFL